MENGKISIITKLQVFFILTSVVNSITNQNQLTKKTSKILQKPSKKQSIPSKKIKNPNKPLSNTSQNNVDNLECQKKGNNCDKTYCKCIISHWTELACYQQIIGTSISYNCNNETIDNKEFIKRRQIFFNKINICIKNYEKCYLRLPETPKKYLNSTVINLFILLIKIRNFQRFQRIILTRNRKYMKEEKILSRMLINQNLCMK